MAVKIQNTYNKESGSYDKDSYDIKHTEKAIFGRFNMSKKDESGKWASASIGFVAFKKDLDSETIKLLTQYSGESLNVAGEPMLGINKNDGKGFVQFNLRQARAYEKGIDKHSKDKGNGYAPQSRGDDWDDMPY
jgi:hypothetical protein